MNPSIIALAQSTLNRYGLRLRVGDTGVPITCWLACAALASEWGDVHPSYFLGNEIFLGLINENNLAMYAYSWARHCQPGEWDCDGYFCSETEFQEWLEELHYRVFSSLLQV